MSKKEKEARKLLKSKKFSEAIDKLNEAGRALHYAGQNDEAIALLLEGDNLSREHKVLFEGTLCRRSLSEIYATLGDREKSLQYVVAFRKLSLKCGSRSQEQLSYHVEAWCLQQLYVNGAAGQGDIERAIGLVQKSRELVESYKRFFKDSDPGGSPHLRTAQLYILEAQLHNLLENNSKALKLLEKAESLLKPKDKSIRFELLRTKCSIVPVNKRVDVAEVMDDEAPEELKAQTLCELSHQYVLANRLGKGYKALAQVFLFHKKDLDRVGLEDVIRRLCIIFRLLKYKKLMKKPNLPAKISMCELHEAIGDLYDKYFRTLIDKEKKDYHQFAKDNILENYEKMLEYKRNDSDALRAYLGMALICGDFDDYSMSQTLFEKRLALLEKTGETEEKAHPILDARISIFNCMCKLRQENLKRSFEDLENNVSKFKNAKRELYEIWANYSSDNGRNEEEKTWRAAAEAIPEELQNNDDDETDFLYKTFSDEEILAKVKEENEFLKLENLTDYQKMKKNDKGETILHQAAQESNNEEKVEMLCRVGCEVDAKDNGGWTPLFEAVVNNELENARILIRYGADVNVRSSETILSGESQSSSDDLNHSKLTPLMDACTNGFIDMARLLIDNKARVDLKDGANWTAYQHLRKHIEDNGADEKMMRFAEHLKNLTANCVPQLDIPVITNRRVNVPVEELSDDSPPDDAEDSIILGKAASRKRRNDFENFANSSKRIQRRSDENFRSSPRPPPSYRPAKKRSIQPSVEAFCQPKRFDRQRSSSSLTSNPRNSMSPRRSMSPATTIRSAPSVFGGDDDVIFAGRRKSMGIPRRNIPSKTPSPLPSKPLTKSPRTSIDSPCSDMIVKCCFQLPPGAVSEEIRPFKLSMNRFLSISEVKKTVASNISSTCQYRIKTVWNKEDEDRCGVDELTLSQVADQPNQREVALVFELGAPQAHEVYQEISKNPIAEVTHQLKMLSAQKKLDLSELFLNSLQISEVTETLNKCERPVNSHVDLSFCELSPKDESNLQSLLEDCIHLRISNASSKSGFSGVFEKQKSRLEVLELIGITFREDTQVVKILKSCPSLKSLNLAGIRISSNSSSLSKVPLAITEMRNLVKLDLSFNSSWISDHSWVQLFKGMEQLVELTMNETKSDVQFESWLPNLSSFTARGSDLHWESFFEKFSISDKITCVDVRHSTIDSSLPKDLKNVNPKITEIMY